MEKIVITGRIFERILSKSGFSKADFARHVSKNDKKQRTRQWASHLILQYSTVEMPERWVSELKELVGEEAFAKWVKKLSVTLEDRAEEVRLTSAEIRRIGEAGVEEYLQDITPAEIERYKSFQYEG